MLSAARLWCVLVATAYDPNDPNADHKARAIERDEAGDLAGAIESFRSAAHFAPDVSSNWHNLGVAIGEHIEELESEDNRLHQIALLEASDCFNRALEADPNNRESKIELRAVNTALLGTAGVLRGLGETASEATDPWRGWKPHKRAFSSSSDREGGDEL